MLGGEYLSELIGVDNIMVGIQLNKKFIKERKGVNKMSSDNKNLIYSIAFLLVINIATFFYIVGV